MPLLILQPVGQERVVTFGAGDEPAPGHIHVEILDALASAKAERDSLATQLAELEQLPVVALHPKIAEDYRRQIADLAAALAEPEGRTEVVPILRGLVDQVMLTPPARTVAA